MTVAPKVRLYTGPLSMVGAKAEIALIEKGLTYEQVMVPFDMQRLYEPKHPEVLRINPKRQVPVLVHGDLEIFDSTQIFEYLEDVVPSPPLWPPGAALRARARQVEMMSDEVFFPHIIRLFGYQNALGDPVAVAAREAGSAFYIRMEEQIAGDDFLAGSFSYADIAFFMAQLFGERMSVPLTADMPRLIAWRERMCLRPAVRQVAGAMGAYLIGQGRTIPPFLQAMTPG